ncbi:polysaccharide pyruvyl transferase family protein [Alkalicoccobacillus murimartini]|uniref:Polysaccharide pyruvyl transferase domain-containing protein n=1 Tax=Alkalicoccobacillus murimartini TaxID=171685 RepID=A0ABT9YGL9_9BACI|nr:polysaccharide pyruvyl transferase family protein [Alkalicoccobacillus murimartini]MDQ0206987.1 hypothetical protein [Alkalicoccobacillus murimartini]
MKNIKMNYAKIGNMGDLLNELIVEELFGYEITHSNKWKCETTGIGSSLNAFFPKKSEVVGSFPKKLVKSFYGRLQAPLQVWSTGFINYSDEDHISIRSNVNIAAVRGELSRQRLEKILNRNLDVPTGDGGLLASELVKNKATKKYKVGIIPHFKEKNEQKFFDLLNNYNNSTLIDLTIDPLTVVEQIGECETILSSSLHGLIVADSFGIPNKRLTYTNNLMGDGFKFNDYYSAFNVDPKICDLKVDSFPEVNEIYNDYLIDSSIVEFKKEQLRTSFNKYL